MLFRLQVDRLIATRYAYVQSREKDVYALQTSVPTLLALNLCYGNLPFTSLGAA